MASKDEEPDENGQAPSKEASDKDETLKYHLLGPSLTKAGQDAVDQRKVETMQFSILK
jgi:DNA polymerase kappa